jgi:hypothetical protein
MEDNTKALLDVLKHYAVPDPKIVGKLPKGGRQLDFVGHADITKILIEIDPNWRWVPCGWDNGRPAIHVQNGIATMWGELQLLGQGRLGVGSVAADKGDLDKELVSDFLRNAAMRFGICLSLWTKQEWDDVDQPAASKAQPRPTMNKAAEVAERMAAKAAATAQPQQISEEQRNGFVAACDKAGLDPSTVAANAGLDWSKPIMETDLAALREAFKELKTFKDGQ